MGATTDPRANDEMISMILNWDERDRAKLTYRLLLSFEDTSAEEASLTREDIAFLWEKEAERRVADFDSGTIGCVTRKDALRLASEDLAK